MKKNKIIVGSIIAILIGIISYLCYSDCVISRQLEEVKGIHEEYIKNFNSLGYYLSDFKPNDTEYYLQSLIPHKLGTRGRDPLERYRWKFAGKKLSKREQLTKTYLGKGIYTYEEINKASEIIKSLHKDLEYYPLMSIYYDCLSSNTYLVNNEYYGKQALSPEQLNELESYNSNEIQQLYDKYKDYDRDYLVLYEKGSYIDVLDSLYEYINGNRVVNVIDPADYNIVLMYDLDSKISEVLDDVGWYRIAKKDKGDTDEE